MEWENWFNVYSQASAKSSLLKCPNVCFEIRAFLTHLGEIFLQSLHLPLHPKPLFPHPSQKSFEQNKEMTFDRRLASLIREFEVYIAPPLKIWYKRFCMKSRWIVKASLKSFFSYFCFTSTQPIRPKEASDSDFTIEDVMLWPGMRFYLRSQCKRCSAGRLGYRSILSNTPTAHHCITWQLGIGNKYFLACVMLFFNVQWIFSTSATSCSVVIT